MRLPAAVTSIYMCTVSHVTAADPEEIPGQSAPALAGTLSRPGEFPGTDSALQKRGRGYDGRLTRKDCAGGDRAPRRDGRAPHLDLDGGPGAHHHARGLRGHGPAAEGGSRGLHGETLPKTKPEKAGGGRRGGLLRPGTSAKLRAPPTLARLGVRAPALPRAGPHARPGHSCRPAAPQGTLSRDPSARDAPPRAP